jgi:hypothetical protein
MGSIMPSQVALLPALLSSDLKYSRPAGILFLAGVIYVSVLLSVI